MPCCCVGRCWGAAGPLEALAGCAAAAGLVAPPCAWAAAAPPPAALLLLLGLEGIFNQLRTPLGPKCSEIYYDGRVTPRSLHSPLASLLAQQNQFFRGYFGQEFLRKTKKL